MKIKSNFKIREIAGEKMVLMHCEGYVDMTKAILLNRTAEWLLLSLNDKEFTNCSVEELITQRYGIDKERAQKDAASWIESMIKAGLIEE